MTLAERVMEAIGAIKPAELARAMKMSPGAVSQWRNGGIKSLKVETAAKLEKITGYSAVWLGSGKGPKMAPTSNVQSVTTKGRVPLISWVAAGAFREKIDMYQPGEAEQWIDAYDTQPGEQAFALRVDGDSMTSPYPGERSFPDGTIIIVDPARSCDAGDYVVAKDVSTQSATFKKLVQDGGRWFLKPLNPTYPTTEIDTPALRVIGRVIEFRYGGKL